MSGKNLTTLALAGALSAAAAMPAQAAEPIAVVDFADYRASDRTVSNWLERKGFVFERAAKDPNKIAFSVAGDALQIDARRQTFGLIYKEMEVADALRVRLTWGINDYPDGASYAKGVNNEALMVYVFFGKETRPSGAFYIPDFPYFIGLYLCDADQVDEPYTGRFHKDSGRFVCLGQPAEGERVTSEINLAEAFETYFGTTPMPTISGFSLEVDTGDSGNGGVASAFIEKIEFLP